MYPNITDILNDLFGTQLQFPIRSFGFFVAVAFMSAYLTIKHDLKRRTGLGHFPLRMERILISAPVKVYEIGIQFLIWGLIGYKIGFALTDAEMFNTQLEQVMLSTQGNIWVGLIAGVVAAGLKFWKYQKTKGQEEKWEEQEVGPDHFMPNILLLAFVGGVGGAKIFHLLENMGSFLRDPMGMLLSMDGLTFYGGLITAGVMIAIYLKKKNYTILTAMDAFTPGLMLSYGVGRMGCQVAGDGDWGIDNLNPKPDALSWLPDWTWAFRYPGNTIGKQYDPETHQLLTRPLENCTNPNPDFCFELINPVYPTPLYEIIMALGIFALLWFVFRKRFVIAGQLSGVYLFFNGLERFFIEKIRINTKYILFGTEITQAEIISGLLILSGIVLFVLVTVRKKTINSVPASPTVPPKNNPDD